MFRTRCFAPRAGPAALAALLLSWGAPVRADTIDVTVPVKITFDFNALPEGAGNTAIRNYMNGVIGAAVPGGSVTVTGARVEASYTGDGHAVGPLVSGRPAALTLGTTDGSVPHLGSLDSFLVNSGSDRITMEFSFPIFGVSFDYQIFPDGTLPDGTVTTPANPDWPDFSFRADGTLVFRTQGVMPGEGGTFAHSPNSGAGAVEVAPQFLGGSGPLLFPGGVTKLEFVDWPRLIGIDNLTLDTGRVTPQQEPPGVPEPATLVVLGAALAGAAAARRWRRRA